MQPLHPLLGVQPPELMALLERADPSAAAVLTAARRLRSYRLAEQADLRARSERSFPSSAWAVDGPRLIDSPDTVLEGDLLHALMALEPERLAAPFRKELSREDFEAACERCARALEDAPMPDPGDGLDPAWARRWALFDERHGEPSITLSTLIGSLGENGLGTLAGFDTLYREGLVTNRESIDRYLAHATAEIQRCVFDPVPPVYLDRGERLDALEHALDRSGGAIVLGPAGSGRSALVEAWMANGTHDLHPSLDPHLGPYSFEDPGPPVEFIGPMLVGMTAARMTGARYARALDTGIILDESDMRRRRDRWLERHQLVLEDGSLQLLLVLDPTELDRLRRSVPALERLEIVTLTEPEPLELAMIWLAHTMPHPELGLAAVLTAFRALGVEQARRIDPWCFADLVEPLRLRGCFDQAAAWRSMRSHLERKLLELYDQGTLTQSRVRRSALGRLGGEPALEALIELDERLFGPRARR